VSGDGRPRVDADAVHGAVLVGPTAHEDAALRVPRGRRALL